MNKSLLPIGTRVAVRFGKITRHGEIYDHGPRTYSIEIRWGKGIVNYSFDHNQVTAL